MTNELQQLLHDLRAYDYAFAAKHGNDRSPKAQEVINRLSLRAQVRARVLEAKEQGLRRTDMLRLAEDCHPRLYWIILGAVRAAYPVRKKGGVK